MTTAGWTVSTLVADARRRLTEAGIADAATDARLLVAGLLGLPPTELLTRGNETVEAAKADPVDAAIERRLGHEPVHRILGEREFYGLALSLSAGTLEPRPDTEILVDTLLPYLRNLAKTQSALHILDMGTGTGAICLALLSQIPEATGIGSDISPDALNTANANATKNGLQERFETRQSNWFENVEGRFHAIVSNPPYIATSVIDDLATEVKRFDPLAALDGGRDGLDAYRAIAKDAAKHLKQSGVIGVEIGFDQRDDVTKIFVSEGFRRLEAVKDYGQNDRVLVFAHVA